MSYIYGSIPFFECLVRAEYTRDRKDRHGEYYPAVAHAVRCVRGHTLWFQVIFTQQHAGAAFMLPLEALVIKPCAPVPTSTVQPWDVFSSDFGVSQDTFTGRGAVSVLPDRTPGQYRFTIDFAGSDLAEHPDQHKALHVVFREDGIIGAYPNNRLLWHDPAFWTTSTEQPDFISLSGEFRAEGSEPDVAEFRRQPDASKQPSTLVEPTPCDCSFTVAWRPCIHKWFWTGEKRLKLP